MGDVVKFVSAIGEQRENLIANPSAEVDAANWTAVNGTVTRVAPAGIPFGSAVFRYTSTTAVAAGNYAFSSASTVSPGKVYTASAYVRMGAQVSDYRILLRYYNAGVPVPGGDFLAIVPSGSLSASTFTRISVSGTAPATADSARVMVIASAALTVGGIFEYDAVMLEPGAELLSYGDGSFSGWSWNGTAHASASRSAQFSSTRLDLNDETTFWVKRFNAAPPRLRRSTAANAMRDGIVVGSSTYDARTLEIELECRKDNQDDAAAAIQQLWRELDRANNYLMYQPEGASKPVFFRAYRSDTSQLEDVMAQAAMRTFTVEVLAEPHALGLRETLGPYVIANDPAAASNPCYVDISGVLGDVATEAIFWNQSSNRAATLMAIRHGDFSDLRTSVQAETLTLGADTTNPGGGPDAAMSGTGTNNFVRTSFATTPGNAMRMWGNTSPVITDQFGSFVLYAAVRRSGAASVIRVGVSNSATVPPTEMTAVPLTGSRQLVRLGRYSTDSSFNYSGKVGSNPNYYVWAERVSGAETIDWDCIFLIPADDAMLEALSHSTSGSAGGNNVFDGVADRAMSIFAGGNPLTLATEEGPMVSSGRIPQLMPGVSSRLHFITMTSYNTALGSRTIANAVNNTVSISYWPRYMHVRPIAS